MLTHKDEELIALLRVNARESVAALARKLGVSRTTIQDRLKRLESQGIISGYSIKLSSEVGNAGIGAYINLDIEPHCSADVTGSLGGMPQIEAIYTVSGKFDIVVFARCKTAEDMDALLDAIGLIEGVRRTESAIVLSTKLDRR